MPKARILIVDDDQSVQDVLTDMLESEGYETVAVGDADAAVRQAKARECDIAFIDIHMPGHDGLETLRMLRKVLPDARCVMITGLQDEFREEACLREGAETCLYKPLRLATLIQHVERLLATSRPRSRPRRRRSNATNHQG